MMELKAKITNSLYLLDTGRKWNVHKTSWMSSERLMYVQFTSCFQGRLFLQKGQSHTLDKN